jgi:hypothetical protein
MVLRDGFIRKDLIREPKMGYNMAIKRGADFAAVITLVGYTDLSYTALCYIKKSANDPLPVVTPLITKITEDPGCVFRVSLTAAETLALLTKGASYADTERYVYDITVRNPEGRVVRILEGYVFVSPGVTI